MNLKKKLMTSIATMGIAAALVGGATFANFSSTATNDDNIFKAGTLVVTAGPQQYSVDITNLKPGDTKSGQFVIANTGSLPLNYTVTSSGTGELFTGATVDRDGDGILDANNATVTFTSNSTGSLVASTGTATITYTVTLPSAAGNDFQGTQGSLKFNVNATQQ